MVREKSRHARHLSEFELIERFFTHRARAQPERAAAIDNAEAPPRRPLKSARGQFVRSGRNGRGAARIYPRACAAGGARRLARAVFRRRVRARRSIRMRTDWRRYDGGAARALRRDAARAGDDVWISGWLGDARLALGGWRGEWTVADCAWPRVQRALDWPQPRIALGRALTGIAHAAIDLSDGLTGDLMHLLTRSNVCAVIDIDQVPRSAALA